MDNKKKIATIVEGALTIVIGVLIAVFGAKTLNLYFGILFLIAGAGALIFELYSLIQLKKMTFGLTLLGSVCVVVGSFFVADKLTIETFVMLFAILLLGLGAALILYGIYATLKVNTPAGICLLVIGAGALVVSILYLTENLGEALWIIVGVLVALYGAYILASAFMKNGKKASN